jgi:hypothetical protein
LTEEPNNTPADDLTITIHVERPKPGNPEGRFSMSTEILSSPMRQEAGPDGPHDEHTVKRVMFDVYAYCITGKKAWLNRIDRNGHDDERRR